MFWVGIKRESFVLTRIIWKEVHLSWSWYGVTRLSGGRRVCSRCWVSCIVSMSKEYPGVLGPSGGVVKALVNSGAGRLWPSHDSDMKALHLPLLTPVLFQSNAWVITVNSWPCCYQYTSKQLQNIYACWQKEIRCGCSGFTPIERSVPKVCFSLEPPSQGR